MAGGGGGIKRVKNVNSFNAEGYSVNQIHY